MLTTKALVAATRGGLAGSINIPNMSAIKRHPERCHFRHKPRARDRVCQVCHNPIPADVTAAAIAAGPPVAPTTPAPAAPRSRGGMPLRLAMAGEKHHATGLLIQPMHHQHLLPKLRAQPFEHAIGFPPPRNRRQAGGLVDDRHIRIRMQKLEKIGG